MIVLRAAVRPRLLSLNWACGFLSSAAPADCSGFLSDGVAMEGDEDVTSDDVRLGIDAEMDAMESSDGERPRIPVCQISVSNWSCCSISLTAVGTTVSSLPSLYGSGTLSQAASIRLHRPCGYGRRSTISVMGSRPERERHLCTYDGHRIHLSNARKSFPSLSSSHCWITMVGADCMRQTPLQHCSSKARWHPRNVKDSVKHMCCQIPSALLDPEITPCLAVSFFARETIAT